MRAVQNTDIPMRLQSHGKIYINKEYQAHLGVPAIFETTSFTKPTGPALLPTPENKSTGHPNAALNA
jgi:hypothetical protein